MATYKIKHFKRVTLLNKEPVGYIMVLQDGADPAHYYTLWGGQDSDGFQLTDWGHAKATFDTKEYEDGFTSTILVSGITNKQTITAMSASDMTANGTLDLNSVLVGVTPRSIDAGIAQTSDGTTDLSISPETYKAFARMVGWILSHSASTVVLACDPLVALNFGAYALIANYMEVTIALNTGVYTTTTKRVSSRVRWGNSGSALCQVIAGEVAGSTAGYQDCIETPGQITGAIPFDDRVVVLKNESIYELIYSGYPRVFDASIVVPDNGTLSTKAIAKTGRRSFFFIGNDSFYIYKPMGELENVGKNIRERFFGSNADYSLTDLQKAIAYTYDDRQEVWVWFPFKQGAQNSEIYKLKGGEWTMTDYNKHGHGHIGCIGKDYYVSGTNAKGWVPIIFFDELNLTTTDSADYGLLTLDVAPGTAWSIGNTITGVTSGATCVIHEILSTTLYVVTNKSLTDYTLGEVLTNGTYTADQGAAHPVYTANKLATLNCYRDLQTGVSGNTGSFETKDYALDIGGRATAFRFQAKCSTGTSGVMTVYYSTDEGRTWSTGVNIEIHNSPDLEWYGITFDVTSESIRFKAETEDDISIGKQKLTASERKREEIE